MKGIFYSMIAAILILPLIMLAVSIVDVQNSSVASSSTKVMGSKLSSYSKSIEDDLPRALPIMAKRSIGDALVYIDTSGNALTDTSDALKELMINGTLYGNLSSIDFTMKAWTYLLEQKGREYGFTTAVDVLSVRFYSPDSYTVNVEAVVGVNVSIPGASMSLYRIYNTTSAIHISGFSDPIYTIKTNGIMKRSITAPLTPVSGTESFDNAVGAGLYMSSVEGAGLLDRMEGRLFGSGKYNTSAAGLESVVYLPDLQANGITIDQTKTDIDYLYFDTTYHQGSDDTGSSYSWLKVDNQHATVYNLTVG